MFKNFYFFEETFPKMSNVYTMQKTTFNWFNNTMVVFIPLFGAAALMVLICLLGFILRKKYKKFLKETKKVPEELVRFFEVTKLNL